MDAAAKQAIGQSALQFVNAEGYVYLDAGTSVLPLAQLLKNPQHRRIHFVTNDVSIALELARHDLNHTLLSGRLHPVTQTISGPASLSQITDFHFDTCFISADGIDSEYGITCSINDEACLKRHAMKQSQRKVLLAASGKWGQRFGSRIGPLDRFDIFVTEKTTPVMKKSCRSAGLNLILAESSTVYPV
jgi:DeoR family fructose operon transcriptional repressor